MFHLGPDARFGSFNGTIDFVNSGSLFHGSNAPRAFSNMPLCLAVKKRRSFGHALVTRLCKGVLFFTV
jgi:hypothetical protein